MGDNDPRDTFENYLRDVDRIIRDNIRGYEAAAREVIGQISLTPLEPCNFYYGIINHIRALGQQGIANGVSSAANSLTFEGEDSVPAVIITEEEDDDEVELANANLDRDNLDPSIHLYLDPEDCTDHAIYGFHQRLITTGERFRRAVDDLINERESLSDLALSFQVKPAPKCKKFTEIPAIMEERKNTFYRKNKIDIEKKISTLHFRIEALRQSLIRMFDEIFARRTGLGFALENPEADFGIYIQHTPLISKYIRPEPRENVTRSSKRLNRSVNRSVQTCVVNIKKVADLPKFMKKANHFTLTIFRFQENELNLKKEIDELTYSFGIWLKISKFFYGNHRLFYYYNDIGNIYEVFKLDFLLNPRAMKYDEKLKVIADFRDLIDRQINTDHRWYYYGANSLDTLKAFMRNFYQGFYPHPPKFQEKPFHDELK